MVTATTMLENIIKAIIYPWHLDFVRSQKMLIDKVCVYNIYGENSPSLSLFAASLAD